MHPIRRETLRRKATAALNIAESMEHAEHSREADFPDLPEPPKT